MEDGPAPRTYMWRTFVRNDITDTLKKTVSTVETQNQFVFQSISDDDPETTILNSATFVATSPKEIDAMNFDLKNFNNPHADSNLRDYRGYLLMKSRYRRIHSAITESEIN